MHTQSLSDGILKIYTVFLELICEHKISVERGMLIKNNNHDRDISSPIDKIQSELDEQIDTNTYILTT